MALNRGLDFAQLDELVVDLKLTPDALEVPVPRYFIENRAQVRRRSVGAGCAEGCVANCCQQHNRQPHPCTTLHAHMHMLIACVHARDSDASRMKKP